jgi:hypothetical protein
MLSTPCLQGFQGWDARWVAIDLEESLCTHVMSAYRINRIRALQHAMIEGVAMLGYTFTCFMKRLPDWFFGPA